MVRSPCASQRWLSHQLEKLQCPRLTVEAVRTQIQQPPGILHGAKDIKTVTGERGAISSKNIDVFIIWFRNSTSVNQMWITEQIWSNMCARLFSITCTKRFGSDPHVNRELIDKTTLQPHRGCQSAVAIQWPRSVYTLEQTPLETFSSYKLGQKTDIISRTLQVLIFFSK